MSQCSTKHKTNSFFFVVIENGSNNNNLGYSVVTISKRKSNSNSGRKKNARHTSSWKTFDLLTHTFVFDGYYLLFCHLNGNRDEYRRVREKKTTACNRGATHRILVWVWWQWCNTWDGKKVCKICSFYRLYRKNFVLNAVHISIRIECDVIFILLLLLLLLTLSFFVFYVSATFIVHSHFCLLTTIQSTFNCFQNIFVVVSLYLIFVSCVFFFNSLFRCHACAVF